MADYISKHIIPKDQKTRGSIGIFSMHQAIQFTLASSKGMTKNFCKYSINAKMLLTSIVF